MEINKILSSDYLDIIFEGRNKDYGAYELRKTYHKRLAYALTGTAVILLVAFEINQFTNKFSASLSSSVVDSIRLVEIKPDEVHEIPPVIKQKPKPIQLATIQYTTPLIVKNNVTDNDKPPLVEDLEVSRIGKITQAGVIDDEMLNAPVTDNKRGIIAEPPKDLTDYDKPFLTVQIESTYPGGVSAWMRYLNKTFRYPNEAQEIDVQGTVVVQFIVDKEGNVSDVEAVSGPTNGGLREEAVRVIRKSGKWEPAIQNGRKVKSYKKQPITFKLETQ